MEEIWKDVVGYEDYLISNCGRLKTKQRSIRYVHAVTGEEHFRSTSERHLKQFVSKQGYKFVILYKDKKANTLTIHRLVATNFIDNPHNYNTVNHKDGIKFNNTSENLEWCTDSYNHEHSARTGLLASGSRVGTSKLNEKCVVAIRKLLDMGWSHVEIAELFEVTRSTITLINTGKAWSRALTGTELTIKL